MPFEIWIEDHDLPADPVFWSRFFRDPDRPLVEICRAFGVEAKVALDWVTGAAVPDRLHALRAFALWPEAFQPSQELAA